ncbi:MAG: hypothetical protein GF331_17465 [Chitinivibrionales bacterium]|nr:hypothetical protein [Chitinivibrionales bacterium]
MRIILDTDIDTDCDDAGALAVLHHYHGHTRAQVLGIVCSIPLPVCAQCVRAINAWYKHDDIPIGLIDRARWQGKSSYPEYQRHRESLGAKGMLYNEHFAADTSVPADTPEAVDLYRSLLAQQPDRSVTICSIGTLTALSALLDSPPDDVSPLTGKELIERKVRLLVTMAVAGYPHGCDGFNWRMDLPSAVNVMQHWPGPVAVQPIGGGVLTGQRFMAEAPPEHPVREVYRVWLEGWGKQNRSSPDQLAVIYAVEGARELFEERTGLRISIDPQTGTNTWSGAADGPERILVGAAVDEQRLAAVVEDLMVASLG